MGDGHRDEAYWDEEGDHNLLVPGKVLLLYQTWGGSGAHKAVWTNGTTKILKGLELGGLHLTVSYYHGLKSLQEIVNLKLLFNFCVEWLTPETYEQMDPCH